MDEGDYPAAHSMDTAFFAVDRDGNVGYFRCGPSGSGAVPVTGEVGMLVQELNFLGGREELLAELAQLLPPCEVRLDPTGHRSPHLFGQPQQHDCHGLGFGLLFLKSLDPALRAEIAAGRGVELPAVGAVAVQALGLPRDLVARLHDEGHCLGCYFCTSSQGWLAASPATSGLFCYRTANVTGTAWPYGRREVPVRPVHIDQLPPDLRQQFGRLQLDCAFAERAYVQPAEHWPCTSIHPAFLSSDGRKTGRLRDVAGEH
jgi:hypothetical protein